MKALTVFALVCAMMVLIEVAAGNLGCYGRPFCDVAEATCSNGWTQIENRCFRYVSSAMTWASAEKNCRSLGGHLASIHSTLQDDQIQLLIRRAGHGDQEAWVGGSDAQENNYWLWSDGTRFDYSRWCSGEPNNRGGRQHCLQMNYSGSKCWDDLHCWAKRPSVCVKRLN